MRNTIDKKETYNDFEILCTARTLNENLIRVCVEENDDSDVLQFEGRPGSDFIIHILSGGDDPEEYIHVKSGTVVAVRPFMYTRRYLKCRPGKDGRLKAII